MALKNDMRLGHGHEMKSYHLSQIIERGMDGLDGLNGGNEGSKAAWAQCAALVRFQAPVEHLHISGVPRNFRGRKRRRGGAGGWGISSLGGENFRKSSKNPQKP